MIICIIWNWLLSFYMIHLWIWSLHIFLTHGIKEIPYCPSNRASNCVLLIVNFPRLRGPLKQLKAVKMCICKNAMQILRTGNALPIPLHCHKAAFIYVIRFCVISNDYHKMLWKNSIIIFHCIYLEWLWISYKRWGKSRQ